MIRLPALIDRPTLQRELGVSEHVAERLIEQAGAVRSPAGVRKIYARRDDIRRLLDSAVLEPTPKLERTSVSAWIRTRHTKNGEPRFMVMYRRGGRGTKPQNANTFRTRKEARLRRDLVAGWLALGLDPKVELAKLLNPEPQRTLADWFDAFIDSRIDVTAKTLDGYRIAKARTIPALGHVPLDQLKPDHVQQLIVTGWSDLAPGTITGYLAVLRMVLDHAELESNPARSRKIRLPKDTSEEPTPPTSREWRLILEHVAEGKQLCLRLMECCGLRVSEAVGLTEGDIDAAGGKIRISKARTKGRSSGQRWLPVPAELLDPIVDGLDGNRDRRVFQGLNVYSVRFALRDACVRAKVGHYHPHDLRHRRISLWLAHGFDPLAVKTWAGHAKASMSLDRYGHVMAEPHLDEWRGFWSDSYRAERLERRGLDLQEQHISLASGREAGPNAAKEEPDG